MEQSADKKEVTEMSEKLNKRAVTIIIAVIAVIAVIGGTLAWFVTQSSLSQKFTISGIKVSADVFFDANGENISAGSYKDSDGLYTLSLNKNDKNYIGNLRVNVNETGSKACLRVRMSHEWITSDGKIAQYTTSVPYKFAENWYDNRDTDYCVYYQGENLSGKTDFNTKELINGFDESSFDTAGFDDGTSVKVMIEIDAVQVNRYKQLWNIEKLPWK